MKINKDEIDEAKTLNISFTTSGSGSTSCRLPLPTTWIRDRLGLTKENRQVEVLLVGDNIIIRPKNQE